MQCCFIWPAGFGADPQHLQTLANAIPASALALKKQSPNPQVSPQSAGCYAERMILESPCALPELSSYHTTPVRHLAWLCQASQLLTQGSFEPAAYITPAMLETLACWDQNPTAGPQALSALPHYRLGVYVESLYACLLGDLLGWQILARNLPIRSGGTTLGELDFVVRNPNTGEVEHHEIAIKFYLGYQSSLGIPALWYGPNPRDRLDLKTHKIVHKQSLRCQLPAARATLSALGIAHPVCTRVFMPGYLFYPAASLLHPPSQVAASHARGRWMYWQQAASVNTTHWVRLKKPHWLGPWQQTQAPNLDAGRQNLDEIRSQGIPGLFAALTFNPASKIWQETDRIFVVPESWPGLL